MGRRRYGAAPSGKHDPGAIQRGSGQDSSPRAHTMALERDVRCSPPSQAHSTEATSTVVIQISSGAVSSGASWNRTSDLSIIRRTESIFRLAAVRQYMRLPATTLSALTISCGDLPGVLAQDLPEIDGNSNAGARSLWLARSITGRESRCRLPGSIWDGLVTSRRG